ncbi:DUF1835 domain-containing protein [Alkalihalobacillus sp. LMS39]|uniref:DUF1835 domain-containing protein n=1 Tax=Alkalihalobacillus sp. LMS39 TaxID=2924032 RepID=UPI001FB41058|nr:DUF1835 domain-containing protein [Alkalihalobacillus sp. LMS39]UOE95175.1 DUF1835 domain-containing protein [Alkalihalobacillus sp. LMS39]
MIDEVRRIIKHSTEDEVKSLLLQTMLRMDMLEETDEYSERQFVADLKAAYRDFLDGKRNQAKINNKKSYNMVHILFGDSQSGSLKIALKEMEREDEERVISFSDMFSIGPIWNLHSKVGQNKRNAWIKNNILVEENDVDEYEHNFNETISMINGIPSHIPIMIWVGENAHEQTALRFVLYLIKHKINEIFLIDTTKQYKKLFDVLDIDCYPLHTGEIAPEKLRLIYETSRNIAPLSQEHRKKMEAEWQALSSTKEVLRVWEKNEINSVHESYYDDYIIQKADKLQKERNNNEFMKSARLIGEVIGHLCQYIGDEYLEYRVRHLIMNGVFEIEGVPKAMRFYSVRLKSSISGEQT